MKAERFNRKPLLCQELIGRDNELKELTAALELAEAGNPQLILLSGEAGLGKTRLCQAVAETPQAQFFLLLSGQSLAQSQSWPFGPFLDAFRRYFRALARVEGAAEEPARAALPHLLRILPELQPLFSDIIPLPPPETVSPAQQQYHLFQSVLDGLRAMLQSAQEPILLILEDLQWADETSLELLAFLGRQLGTNLPGAAAYQLDRIFILGTYRSEAVGDNPALGRVLAQLNNQRQARTITLTPLGPVAHARLVASILGQPVSTEFNNLLYQRDEGNPFFAEELLGATVNIEQLKTRTGYGTDWAGTTELNLPLSLKAAIVERVANLPESDQEVLAYAATVGREFDFDLLAALTGLNERELLAVLRRAVNLQLIEELDRHRALRLSLGESERFQFRHALTRETIYSEMLTRERRMRHREVAAYLEKLGANAPAKELNRLIAEHYWLAGLPDRAKPYALQEAENARQLFAFGEERRYLQIVLSALPANHPERLPLLHRLGLLSVAMMDVPAALDWLNQAKTGYQQAGQPRREAAVLVHLTFLFWFFDTKRMPGLVEELEAAALATFETHDPVKSPQDAEALSIYAQTAFSLVSADKHRRGAIWLERSYQLARQWPDPIRLQAFQLSLLARGASRADSAVAEVDAGLKDMRQVIDYGLENAHPDLVLAGYGVLLQALTNLGRNEQAEALIRELTKYETRTSSSPMSNLKGWYRFFSGDWEPAISELREQLTHPNSPTVLALYRVALAHFLVARAELTEARQQLEAALPQLEPLEFCYFGPALWGLAKLQAAEGEPEEASATFNRLWQFWKTTEDAGTIVPILLNGIEFFAKSGNLRQSRQWLAELQTMVEATANPVAQAALAEAEAIQAEAEGSVSQAINHLETALTAWDGLQRPYYQARAAHRLAALLLDQPNPDRTIRERAENRLNQAGAEYQRLQIASGVSEVENLLQNSRLQAQSKRRATLAASRQAFQGLTRREVQVLVEICAGLTNKEIANNLSISEGTVELHVNHILTKLNCETRVQAATYAIKQGWVKNSG